jgi:xanthine dehydrogenase FAD-binding subunit
MFDLRTLYEPRSVAEAVSMLVDHPEARVMAGGSDNLVKLRDGHLGGLDWVSIYAIDDLRRIEIDADGALRIGALASFASVADYPDVRRTAHSLADAVATIGGPQVRNIGTIGGNLCNGVPSADSASTCYAWDAVLELTGPGGVRTLPVADFYLSVGKVDLRPGELLTAIVVPRAHYAGYKGAYSKYAMRGAMDIATVNCSTTVRLTADARSVDDVRIAFGVAAPTPIRAPHGEDALRGRPTTQDAVNEAAAAALQDTRARDSWRASKAFREHLLEEIARRCLLKSIKRAGGEVVGVHS